MALKVCVTSAAARVGYVASMPQTVSGLCPGPGHVVKGAREAEVQPHPPARQMEQLPVVSKALGGPVAAGLLNREGALDQEPGSGL